MPIQLDDFMVCCPECEAVFVPEDGGVEESPADYLTPEEFAALKERAEYWKTQKALGLHVNPDALFELIDELTKSVLVEG